MFAQFSYEYRKNRRNININSQKIPPIFIAVFLDPNREQIPYICWFASFIGQVKWARFVKPELIFYGTTSVKIFDIESKSKQEPDTIFT